MPPGSDFQGTDRFEVLRRLGSGSFGSVYEALDRSRGVRVALKVPHDPEARSLLRFKQEFRALAEVSHPNLVSLFELVSSEGQWFFTMELLEGTDLYTALRALPRPAESLQADLYLGPTSIGFEDPPTPPFPSASSWGVEGEVCLQPILMPSPVLAPDRLRRLFIQVAEGLRGLHGTGLLHRDLKPSNVLVTPEDRVVILDFGLAVPVLRSGQDGPEPVVGTPAYLSPELLDGAAGTEAGDWYSFGVMLFQVLTGVLPFSGAFSEILRRKREEEAPDPRRLVQGLPEDLIGLTRALLDRDPGRRPSPEEVMARLDPAAGPLLTPLSPVREDLGLPGCHPEAQEALGRAFERVRGGQPAAVVVHSRPGMGKSAVARQFMQDLRARSARTVVLHARCYAQESLPYKAVDGLVDDLAEFLRLLSSAERAALLPEQGAALARVFPVLNQIPELAGTPSHQAEPHTIRRWAFRAFRELLHAIALRHPLVLVIEDLQWGDRDSEALLLDTLEPPDAPPLLLLLTCDSEEVPSHPLLARLRASDTGVPLGTVELGLLSPERCLQVARAAFTRAEDREGRRAEWAARESGGHPFFLAELIHALRQRPHAQTAAATNLEEHIQSRLAALPAPAHRVASLLAVAGHPMDWSVLLAAAGLEGSGETFLPLLRNAHLLRVRSAPAKVVEFFHDRFRKALVQSMDETTLGEGHHTLALALERLAPREVGALALHYGLAGERAKAADYARQAAELAIHALAFDRAADLYRQSLGWRAPDDPDRPTLHLALAEALVQGGRGREAAEAFLEAAAAVPEQEVPSLHRRAAEAYFRSGHIAEAIHLLTPHLRRAGAAFPGTRIGALLSLAFWRLRLRIRGLQPAERVRDAPRLAERVDLLWAVAMGLAPVDPFRSASFQAQQLWHTLRLGDPRRLVRALAHETLFQAMGGSRNLRRTRQVLELTRRWSEVVDQPDARGRHRVALGLTALCQGHWLSAARTLEEAEQLLSDSSCLGLDHEMHIAQYYGLTAHGVIGNLPLLCQRLPELIQQAMELDNRLAATQLRVGLALFPALCRDDPEGALRELHTTLCQWPQGGFETTHGFELASRVNVELYQGRPSSARARLRGAWPELRRSMLLRVQTMRITFLELRGRLALGCAALAPEDSLRRSLLLSRAMGDARRLHREHVAYGEALGLRITAGAQWLRGREEVAEETLRQAEDAFRSCDMPLHGALCALALARWTSTPAVAEEATQWLKAQGVQRPERWLAMHFPVFSLP